MGVDNGQLLHGRYFGRTVANELYTYDVLTVGMPRIPLLYDDSR